MSLSWCRQAAKKKFLASCQLRGFSNHHTGKARIALTLYRQLIAWCRETDNDIPLSHFIPPITLQPPRVEEQGLRSLAEAVVGSHRVKRSMFPSETTFHPNKLTSPILNSSDLLSFFRAIFRLNMVESNSEIQKQHISLAFDALRSLNELSDALNDLKTKREAHQNRENIEFRVGQVVRHNIEEWRGVVIGWERIEKSTERDSEEKLSSLTSKTYNLDQNVRVAVLLDSGDAHMHYSKRREPGDMSTAEVFQSDLSPVENGSLCRLRSTHISEYFTHFDSKSNSFVPNELKSYEFPTDRLGEAYQAENSVSDKAANEIVSGVQALAEKLAQNLIRAIVDEESAQESGELKLLTLFVERLTALSSGDVFSPAESSQKTYVPSKLAIMHIQQLHNLVVNVGELLWQRRVSLESNARNKFGLGEIVRHKGFGFRGVIVAWDPTPTVDVSRWDGLQHITDPHQYPFYHIVPDQNDCIEAFGGERPWRYVCEENLEICPLQSRDVEIDLEPEWLLDRSDMKYNPPADILFKYGGDMDDDGLTVRCLEAMKDEISRLFVALRDHTQTSSPHIDAMAGKLSYENLFVLLKTADTMYDAAIVSEVLKEIWKSHVDLTMRLNLDTAVSYLLNGNTERALLAFRELVADDPEYAEAWNKISTCEFILGRLDASLASAQKALYLIPTHYQALNGMGLVHYERNEVPLAVENFQKSLELDPWSSVSSRLADCLKLEIEKPEVK